MSATRPGDRILDRDHGEPRLTVRDRRECVLEGGTRQGLPIRVGFLGRDMGVRARLALERDCSSEGHGVLRAMTARARSRDSGVSTPSGT